MSKKLCESEEKLSKHIKNLLDSGKFEYYFSKSIHINMIVEKKTELLNNKIEAKLKDIILFLLKRYIYKNDNKMQRTI